MPTSESVPPGTARPEAWVARSSSAQTPRPGHERCRVAVHFDRLRQRQIDDESPVADRGAGAAVSAAAYSASSSRSLANRTAEATSAWFRTVGDQRRTAPLQYGS